ncbi:hypothetical protein BH10PSE19_BH10PSE19_16350 [soil metagenome]
MQTYDPFAIVVVPFPFTDSTKNKNRPALVISSVKFQAHTQHACLLMITSAKHSNWYGDQEIVDLSASGLTVASVVRQKLFTIDMRLIKKQIGKLSALDQQHVVNMTQQHLSHFSENASFSH